MNTIIHGDCLEIMGKLGENLVDGIAAIREGFSFVGIEKEKDYIPIAEARIKTEDKEVQVI